MSHTKVVINHEQRYSIFKHVPLIERYGSFVDDMKIAHQFLKEEFKTDDLTWMYEKYNIFSTLAGSYHYWNLYKDLGHCIRRHLIENLDYKTLPRHMWIQAWLNWHTKDQLLKRHNHADDGQGNMHGFISIEPQDTKTVFYENYEDEKPIYSIDNKIGFIYIGDGNKWHEVINNSDFEGERITIGFDVMTRSSPTRNLGHIPVIY